MGAQSNSRYDQSPIFYDQETGQFYTMDYAQSDNPADNMINRIFGGSNAKTAKHYLSNPNVMNEANYAKSVAAAYPTTESILPTMNASLLSSSALGDASSGAGRYLTPSLLATIGNTSKSSSTK